MLVPEYRQKGKLDVVWCGPYAVPEVRNKGENVRLEIPAPFDGLCVFSRDSIKPFINERVSQCGCFQCHLSRLELLLDSLSFRLGIE